jgi:hypothetical protein
MSKIENPKKVLKKTLFFKVSEHNALIFIFLQIFVLRYFFGIFCEKVFRDFSVTNIISYNDDKKIAIVANIFYL